MGPPVQTFGLVECFDSQKVTFQSDDNEIHLHGLSMCFSCTGYTLNNITQNIIVFVYKYFMFFSVKPTVARGDVSPAVIPFFRLVSRLEPMWHVATRLIESRSTLPTKEGLRLPVDSDGAERKRPEALEHPNSENSWACSGSEKNSNLSLFVEGRPYSLSTNNSDPLLLPSSPFSCFVSSS